MNHVPFVYLFKSPLNCYFYDVNTNQVVKISQDVYDYLTALTSNKNVTPVAGTLEQYKSLMDSGYLKAKRPESIRHTMSDVLKDQLDNNIKQITLQITQQCNFRCTYCSYTQKEFETQRQHSYKRMSYETAIAAIDFMVDHSYNQEEISIGLYGGEPLLEFELIQKIVDYVEKALEGKKVAFTMTTNGSLLNDTINEFLSKHDINVMISLDGTPEIHDRARKFAATGEGTFHAVMKNLQAMANNYPDLYKKLSFNVVIDPRYGVKELYEMFNENEMFKGNRLQSTIVNDFMYIERNVVSEQYLIENKILTLKAYLSFVGKYPKDKISVLKIKEIETQNQRMKQTFKSTYELATVMSHAGPCIPGQRRLFITVDGEFFPCERVNETSEFMKIGSLENGFDYKKADDILNVGKLSEEECKNCWAIRHCTICARLCDNNGELSAELKRSQCRDIRLSTEQKLNNYVFINEIKREWGNEK